MSRAPCPRCGAVHALRRDRTMRRHYAPTGALCRGSYLRAAPEAPASALARIVARHASPEAAIAHLLAVGLRIDPAEVRAVWEAP